MTVVLFLVVLFFLVLVHELGHFVVAKWTKMRVDEFAIGFPPRLWSFRKGETRYALNLLPIGGYVRIFGENGEDKTGEVSAVDQARAFSARPRLHQALVLVAGVTMNILVAWLIFFAIAVVGTPTIVEEGSVNNAKLVVTQTLPDSPAEAVHIPLGAEVVDLQAGQDNLTELTPSAFTDFIGNHVDEPLELTYLDNKESHTVTLRAESNVLLSNPERKIIGLATAQIATIKANPIEALWIATERTAVGLYSITIGIATLFASIATWSANLNDVTGPVGIAGMVGDAAEFGLIPLLAFTAFISLNLAIINLLPIPALDGGRLLFVLVETVIRRPLDPKWTAYVNLTGFAFLILLMLLVTYGDIARLL